MRAIPRAQKRRTKSALIDIKYDLLICEVLFRFMTREAPRAICKLNYRNYAVALRKRVSTACYYIETLMAIKLQLDKTNIYFIFICDKYCTYTPHRNRILLADFINSRDVIVIIISYSLVAKYRTRVFVYRRTFTKTRELSANSLCNIYA